MDSQKQCSKCGTDKSVSDFYQDKEGRPRQPCKACRKAARHEQYVRSGGRDVSYDQVLRREYGITLEEYNEKLRQQAGRCAICRRGESMTVRRTGERRRLAVDHDHVTGAVRGLLCDRCNKLVWAIEDNHTTLDAVRAYVERWHGTFANGTPL